MVKEDFDTGSDTWNVAKGYVSLKILKQLVECDKLVKVSLYGAEEVESSANFPAEMKVNLRVEAMKRLIDELKTIIENSYFVMNKDNKDILDKIVDEIKEVEIVMDALTTIKEDQTAHRKVTSIDEEHFVNCLNALRKIKLDINGPLNSANLIFPSSDDIDLSKLKEQLIHGG